MERKCIHNVNPAKHLQTNRATSLRECTVVIASILAVGRPCNSEFSGSYDLQRHEDTIHNPALLVVQSYLYLEKWEFSRHDGVIKHMRDQPPELNSNEKQATRSYGRVENGPYQT